MKPPRIHLPIGVLKILGAVSEGVAWLTGLSPQVTRGIAEIFHHHWVYDSTKAIQDLAYSPFPIKAGFEAVVRDVCMKVR
jgi:dihydroflavonol-4-reductase